MQSYESSSYNRHLANPTGPVDHQSKFPAPRASHVCELCGVLFHRDDDLGRHYLLHHRDHPRPSSKDPWPLSSQTLTQWYSLRPHALDVSWDSESESPDPTDLEKLGTLLSDGRTWRCAYPGCTSQARFARGCDLRKHHRRHTRSHSSRHEKSQSQLLAQKGVKAGQDRYRRGFSKRLAALTSAPKSGYSTGGEEFLTAARWLPKSLTSRASRVVIYTQWYRELRCQPPAALWDLHFQVDFSTDVSRSHFDALQLVIERYSGNNWDWWPLSAPQKLVQPGKIRMRWDCMCGMTRSADVSSDLAQKCHRMRTKMAEGGNGDGGQGHADPQPDKTREEGNKSAGSNKITSLYTNAQNNREEVQTGSRQGRVDRVTDQRSIQGIVFLLLGINQTARIDHNQLELGLAVYNDAGLFREIRRQYRQLRGFLRYWLSPFIFSHCSFMKYTRFFTNELALIGEDLPVDPQYLYQPRPPGPHDDPPISAHEFRRRFYSESCNPCGRSEAIERIPKRTRRFQTHLHVDGREDMWGLQFELRPSFLRILLWQVVITAGGWALMVYWLMNHRNDLQGAGVPITLILSAMVALWVPLSDKMK